MAVTLLNGVICDVIAGQQQSIGIGIGEECAVFGGSVDAGQSMILHAINYANRTTDNPAGQNTIPVGDVGTMSRLITAIQAVYTPAANLAVGTRLHWDIHAKVFNQWRGVAPNSSSFSALAVDGDYRYSQSDSQYYRYNASISDPALRWENRGGNPTAGSGDDVEDVFGYLIFNIAQSQATGSSAFEPLHQQVTAPQNVNTQLVIAGTGDNTQDTYRNGQAPVDLRASDNDPLAAGGLLVYSAAASSLATPATEGTLAKVNDTTVEYRASGNESIGDEIVFNLVWRDANGDIVYSSLRVEIVANTSGGGTGTTTDPISFNQASLPTSANRRETRPGEVIDLSPYLNNPSGPGIIGATNLVNVLSSDININNTARTMTINKASGGDYQFDFTVI